MALRFTIRNSDIERLQDLIYENRCPDKGRCWIVDLEVSPSIATFSFADKRMQYPIDGHRTGYARFPDFVFGEAKRRGSEARISRELEVAVGHGWLRYVGSTSNEEIEVGYVRNPRSGRIHYTSEAELVALGEMLADASLLHADLPEHIKTANQTVEGTLYRAARDLRNLGIMHDDVGAQVRIDALVHDAIQALKPRLRDRFDTLGIENLWKS